jgi:hypothetical protein
LDKGIAAFLSFFAHVIEERGVAREVEKPHLAIAVGIEASFETAERHRAVAEHLTAPREGFFFQLIERNDRIDQAHIESFLGIVHAAEVPDFSGFLLADDASEVRRTETSIERADLGACLAELSIISGDGEIADDVKDVTTTDSIASDHSDDRLGDGADEALDVKNVEARNAVITDVASIATDLLVATRAESERAFTREDNHTDLGVFMGEVEGVDQLLDSERAKGIADFRAVDGDFSNSAIVRGFVLDVRIIFYLCPRSAHQKE